MLVNVNGKNIEVTQALKDYVEKRSLKITRYFPNVKEINAVLKVEKKQHVVELTVNANSIILRAEERTEDMYEAIDLVVEKIERQIRKYKTKLSKRFRESSNFKAELIEKAIPPEDMSEEFKIVRSKSFPVKPMSVEEAIMQMNLLNHSFFVFLEDESNNLQIVYKRHGGDYGLIDPKIK